MNGHLFWWIDSDEFWLPHTYEQHDNLRQRQRDVFSELHYGRFTYYPFHDRNRMDRMSHYLRQQVEAPTGPPTQQ